MEHMEILKKLHELGMSDSIVHACMMRRDVSKCSLEEAMLMCIEVMSKTIKSQHDHLVNMMQSSGAPVYPVDWKD